MIKDITEWIAQLQQQTQAHQQTCEVLAPQLNGYFPADFLQQSRFMVVDNLPMPSLSGIKGVLAKRWLPKELSAIAYPGCYYILRSEQQNWSEHCRQLVHLAQLQHLGTEAYLTLLYQQVSEQGFEQASLIKMAGQVAQHFEQGSNLSNIPALIKQSLATAEA
ncbi:hypothetical protein [Motilimonas pumila]|uniref:Uncharacterized protein n=1 Tax=Motilimonas pumila TaxID=2303987 RepID=A0A418YBP5_9GAMM|nr:hypothetical protein [Motilimonas pumila]RJG41927.1 hypothetical protein D1Z90_15655 [Motilimonas pumila]